MDRASFQKDPGTVNRKSSSGELTLSFKQSVPIVLRLTQINMLTAKCSIYFLIWKSHISWFYCFF